MQYFGNQLGGEGNARPPPAGSVAVAIAIAVAIAVAVAAACQAARLWTFVGFFGLSDVLHYGFDELSLSHLPPSIIP